MIDTQELVFVVDEHNNPLQPQPRSSVHKHNFWHRTTGIWVITRKQQILCQKRSLKKDIKPGFWEAFFGGHVGVEQTYEENAVQEIHEELGISIKKEDLIPYKILKNDNPTHREFQHIFALLLTTIPNEFFFEKDEIDKMEWKTHEQVKTILLNPKETAWVKKPWDKNVLEWLVTV